MANPVKSAEDIDWDKMAKRLGKAFDVAMKVAENNEENCSYELDEDFREAVKTASAAAEALVKIATEIREGKSGKAFAIEKPTQ